MVDENLEQFTDEQLLDIVTNKYKNYTANSMKIYLDELQRRGIDLDAELMDKINRYIGYNINRITNLNYQSSYKTARTIASFISFIGWFIVSIGGLMALSGLFSFMKSKTAGMYGGMYGGFGATSLLGAMVLIVSGLMLVMGGQVTRAAVDTADNTGRVASMMQNINKQ